jgi:hypothetical protein
MPPRFTSPARTRRGILAGLAAGALAACRSGQQAQPATPQAPLPPTRAATPAPPPPTETPLPPTPTPIPTSPLTGQVVADAGLVRRRIVGVKIDNAPLARPQIALGMADLVYEELAEGGLTRFLAFYLQNEPEQVGPVRSARLTDIYLAEEWEFLLAYAGAGITTSKLLGEALVPLFKAPELGERLDGTPYFRDPRRPIPHNMFVRVAQIREEAKKNPAIDPEVEIRPLPFQPPPGELGPVRRIGMPYIPDAAVVWQYDEGGSTWKRVMAGRPHVDAATNQQIQVENVVLQYAKIFVAGNVEPDSAGNPVLDAVLRGENRLQVFHSGQVFDGTWSKESDRAKTQYRGADGNPMPFRPGKVWIHIVPEDFKASWGV